MLRKDIIYMITPVYNVDCVSFTSRASRLKKLKARLNQDNVYICRSDNYPKPDSYKQTTIHEKAIDLDKEPQMFANVNELEKYLAKKNIDEYAREKFIDGYKINPYGTAIYLDACVNAKRNYYARPFDPAALDIYAKYPKGAKYLLSKVSETEGIGMIDRNLVMDEEVKLCAPLCNTKDGIKNFESIYQYGNNLWQILETDSAQKFIDTYNENFEQIKTFNDEIKPANCWNKDAIAILFEKYLEDPETVKQHKEHREIGRFSNIWSIMETSTAQKFIETYLKNPEKIEEFDNRILLGNKINMMDRRRQDNKVSAALFEEYLKNPDNVERLSKHKNLMKKLNKNDYYGDQYGNNDFSEYFLKGRAMFPFNPKDLIHNLLSENDKTLTNLDKIASYDWEINNIMNIKKNCPDVVDILSKSNIRHLGFISVDDATDLIDNYGDKIQPISKIMYNTSLQQIKKVIDIVEA